MRYLDLFLKREIDLDRFLEHVRLYEADKCRYNFEQRLKRAKYKTNDEKRGQSNEQ